MSGVHWTRPTSAPSIEPAIERASTVFAVPGTSSKSTCPPEASAASTSLISSVLPWTTVSMFASSRVDASSTARSAARCSGRWHELPLPWPCLAIVGRVDAVCDELRRRGREVAVRRAGRHEQRVARDRGAAVDPRRRTGRQSVAPVRAENALIQPSYVGTNTTSRDTVAQRERREPSDRSTAAARRGVERDETPRAFLRRPLEGRRRRTALSVMHSSTTGTKSRPRPRAPSASARRRRGPGQTRVGRRGSGPRSFRWVPTERAQTPPARRAVPGDDATPLARPRTPARAPPAPREDRRDVEVVVADVVTDDLVVPEQRARSRPSSTTSEFGVERRARERAAVRSRLRPAPRARVRDPGVDATGGVDGQRDSRRRRRRRRRSATARAIGVELPDAPRPCARRARRARRGRRARSRRC